MTLPRAVKGVLDVLAFLFGVLLVASLVQLVFALRTWPYQLFAATLAVGVTCMLVRMALASRPRAMRRCP